tara:strand:- start:1439 stop:2146 length:708 start_codon:yes stop_codon:yes gene_type:complete
METILITGVGQRIGLHLANALLDRGYHIIGTFRKDRPALADLRKRGAMLYPCDFYQPEAVHQLLEQINSNYTKLRAIIHNASDWLTDTGVEPDILQKMMQVHVYAPYHINRALAPMLINDQGDATDIIHFSDYVASTGSAKHSAYAASKAALENLTLSMASTWAPNIKVNAIAPALIKFNPGDSDAYRAKTLKKSLLPREGGYKEVEVSVNFLLQSNYITGRVLPLDGGRHLVTK